MTPLPDRHTQSLVYIGAELDAAAQEIALMTAAMLVRPDAFSAEERQAIRDTLAQVQQDVATWTVTMHMKDSQQN